MSTSKRSGVHAVDDVDLLGPVHLVAVLDGVDQGFFQGQADAEDVLFAGLVRSQQSCSISS